MRLLLWVRNAWKRLCMRMGRGEVDASWGTGAVTSGMAVWYALQNEATMCKMHGKGWGIDATAWNADSGLMA